MLPGSSSSIAVSYTPFASCGRFTHFTRPLADVVSPLVSVPGSSSITQEFVSTSCLDSYSAAVAADGDCRDILAVRAAVGVNAHYCDRNGFIDAGAAAQGPPYITCS